MPFDNPQTPQSPSQPSFTAADLPAKPATSPRNTYSLPTPAHSINGSMSSILSDIISDGASVDELSNKRKRSVEDLGDRDQKKVHVEDSRLSIDDLHIDVGKKYLLCRTPHRKPRADVTLDLFGRYGLNDLAKSVARKDSNNPDGKAIRKTYKGIFKACSLSGNFDVERKELGAPDTLFAMMNVPGDEWNAQATGNEVGKGLPENTVTNMSRAFTMARGSIPRSSWNNAVLGEVVMTATPLVKTFKTATSAVKPPQTQAAGLSQSSKEILRPKRNVKKRAYGDASFEGYGEGYVDDDLQEGGYSTGDGEDRAGSRKRPRKTSQSHGNIQQVPARHNSYGPGMVGA